MTLPSLASTFSSIASTDFRLPLKGEGERARVRPLNARSARLPPVGLDGLPRLSRPIRTDVMAQCSSAKAHPLLPAGTTSSARGSMPACGRRRAFQWAGVMMALGAARVEQAQARPQGVNKPEFLPKEYREVLDPAGYLTQAEEQQLRKTIRALEKETGIKLRVLAQNYPDTPGLAVKDYWGVDDDTVALVADPTLGGNILNFNVGDNIPVKLPQNLLQRVQARYGALSYWEKEGEEAAILSAVNAIANCAKETPGRFQCSKLDPRPPELGLRD